MTIKRPTFGEIVSAAGKWSRSTVSLTILLSIIWGIVVTHAAPLVPILSHLDFASASWFVFAIVALLLYWKPNCFIGVYSVILVWFLLLFLQIWSIGLDTYCTAKVLIPIGDSAGYSFEASGLARGNPLSSWGGYRFLSHSMFAVWTFLFDYNAVMTHVVMALLAAISLTLCTVAVAASWGSVAGSLTLVLCGQFFYRSLGTYATETYGLAMGLIGTALILEGVRKERLLWQLCGLFTLGVALSARAGAFFVLPFLGLAFATFQTTWLKRAIVLAGAACCTMAAMSLNTIGAKLLCEPGTKPFGNFWYSLHGMLIGQTWAASAASNTTMQAKEAAVKILSDNPLIIFPTSWKAIRVFFGDHVDYSFLFNVTIAHVMPWLLAAGAIYCLIRLRDRMHRTMLLALLGLVVSIPFVPPWDAGIRPYAATIPLQVIGAVMIIGVLLSAANRYVPAKLKIPSRPTTETHPKLAAVIAFSVLIIGIGLPLLFVHTPMHLVKVGSSFSDGTMHVRIIPGSYIRIVADNAAPSSYVPRIRISDFKHPHQGFAWMFRADNTAIYSRMPEGVIVTRGDAVGQVYIIKDEYGETLPDTIETSATMIGLRGDTVVYDKRLNVNAAEVELLLESIYLSWFSGYDYYYGYHAVLGQLKFIENIPGGQVTVETQNFGVLETSKEMFPNFRRKSDGKILNMDMTAKTLTDVATGELVK